MHADDPEPTKRISLGAELRLKLQIQPQYVLCIVEGIWGRLVVHPEEPYKILRICHSPGELS